jgi:hypothetical protein
MVTIKNIRLAWKGKIRNKITNFKTNLKTGVSQFQENFSKVKSQPRSKRKSFLLGFTTVSAIFGITLFAPLLPVIAKDLPNKTPKPGQVTPALSDKSFLSEEIFKGTTGLVGAICGIAFASGSYVLGAICGVLVAGGILKATKK